MDIAASTEARIETLTSPASDDLPRMDAVLDSGTASSPGPSAEGGEVESANSATQATPLASPTSSMSRPFLKADDAPELEWHVRLAQRLIIIAVQTAEKDLSKAGSAAKLEIEEARQFLCGGTPEHMTVIRFWAQVAGWNHQAVVSGARKKWGEAMGLATGATPRYSSRIDTARHAHHGRRGNSLSHKGVLDLRLRYAL